MLREPLVRAAANTPDDFTIRGREVSRVEGLSDGVFALAMTLLIVSGQVPTSFDELLNVFRGFPAFAACFAVLLWFWIVHYTFFRRFGLNDGTTIFLNSCLLFLVVFYVYPLKFRRLPRVPVHACYQALKKIIYYRHLQSPKHCLHCLFQRR